MRIKIIKLLIKFKIGRFFVKKYLLNEKEKEKLMFIELRKNLMIMGYDLGNLDDFSIKRNYSVNTKILKERLQERLPNQY